MDVVLYIVAAIILLVLIVFAVRVRGRTEEADREERRDVASRAAARPQALEERPAGMPRRRRNLHTRVSAQRAQQASDNEDSPTEADEPLSEERPHAAGKVGAKKQRKLEEKQARKAQREAELEEQEERKKMQELRDQERQKDEEKEKLLEQKRVMWTRYTSCLAEKAFLTSRPGGRAASCQRGSGEERGGGVPADKGGVRDRGPGRSRRAGRARVSQPPTRVHPVRQEIESGFAGGLGVSLWLAHTGCYCQTSGPDRRRFPYRSDRRPREVYLHHPGGVERCGSVHQAERKSVHL